MANKKVQLKCGCSDFIDCSCSKMSTQPTSPIIVSSRRKSLQKAGEGSSAGELKSRKRLSSTFQEPLLNLGLSPVDQLRRVLDLLQHNDGVDIDEIEKCLKSLGDIEVLSLCFSVIYTQI